MAGLDPAAATDWMTLGPLTGTWTKTIRPSGSHRGYTFDCWDESDRFVIRVGDPPAAGIVKRFVPSSKTSTSSGDQSATPAIGPGPFNIASPVPSAWIVQIALPVIWPPAATT